MLGNFHGHRLRNGRPWIHTHQPVFLMTTAFYEMSVVHTSSSREDPHSPNLYLLAIPTLPQLLQFF